MSVAMLLTVVFSLGRNPDGQELSSGPARW
jgi:hypothetical protein